MIFNRPLRILLFTNALVLVAGAMIGPIYAIFVEEVGGDILSAGLSGGIFALAAGLTTLAAGHFTDRIKEKELIAVAGYIIMGGGFLLYLLVNSVWLLFITQAIIGFAEAFYSPSFDALYSQHVTRGKAGRQWGAWEAVNYFTIAGGATLGGLIVAAFGFAPVFVIMALLCFGSSFYIYFLPRQVL